jgi:uncharacterized membrane protein YhaH (DUF805 family)
MRVMEAMFLPLKRYAEFDGRSRRQEYWAFWVFRTIVYVVLWGIVIATFAGTGSFEQDVQFEDISPLAWLSLIGPVVAWLFFFVPTLAVQIRRYHDQNITGWLGLINIPYYIPYIGTLAGFAILILMLIPGTNGPNQYGPDPKDGYDPAWRPEVTTRSSPDAARIDYGQSQPDERVDRF